jgi:hypothetical protein
MCTRKWFQVISGGFITCLFLVFSMTSTALAAQVMKSAPKVAPTQVAPPATQMVAATPDVFVKSIEIVPAQPKAGESFEVRIELFNKGNMATGPNQKCLVSIEPDTFTPAPFPVEGSIAPNQAKLIIKKYVFMEPGNHTVQARPIPGPSNAVIKPFVVAPTATSTQPEPAGKQLESGGTPGMNKSIRAEDEEEVQNRKLHPGVIKHFDPQPEPPGKEKLVVPTQY